MTTIPMQTRDETSHYTDLLADGRASQFNFIMKVKSVILSPSTGMTMQGKGFYEISGLAWSGAGRIVKVEVSADGGRSWALAALQEPVLPQCFTRFRLPWQWEGGPALLQSRAIDEHGDTQPTRAAWAAHSAPRQEYHYNAIQSWEITADGEVRNVYV
jgi:sulfane dehydrogenase subunit SoxC